MELSHVLIVGRLADRGLSDMAAERAKITSKTNLIVEIDLLVAEEDHLVLDERLVKLLHLLVWQRPGQVNIANLRADMRRQRLNGDGFIFHDICSVVGDAIGYAAASWDPLNARMGDDLRPASDVITHERAEFLRARSCDVCCHLVDHIDIMRCRWQSLGSRRSGDQSLLRECPPPRTDPSRR